MLFEIVDDWEQLSEKIGGKVNFTESIRANIDGYLFKPEIHKNTKKGNVVVNQTIMVFADKLQFVPIVINYFASSNRNIDLQIWNKGFFEKIFNIGINIGDNELDNKFCIKSSSIQEVTTLLKNKEFKNYLLNVMTYIRIITTDGIINVSLKVSSHKEVLKSIKMIELIESVLNPICIPRSCQIETGEST
jgi:hypothetical protein